MLEALEAVAGEEARARVNCKYDETISRIVASWPSRFEVSRSLGMGFKGDRTFEDIVRAFIRTQDSEAKALS